MQRLTLAQQISQLEDPTPADFDPEAGYGEPGHVGTGIESRSEIEVDGHDLAAREHYVDVGPSELRKMRDSIADPKYDGVKTSRTQLLEDELDEEPGQEGAYESAEAMVTSRINNASSSSSSASEGDDDMDNSPSLSLQNGDTRTRTKSPRRENPVDVPQPEQSLASSLRDIRTLDKLKGKAVSRQLAIWDSLIDARIRLQKSVTAANKLPHPNNIATYVSNPVGRAAAQTFLSEALQLSDEIFDLRHTLLAAKELTLPPRKRRRIEPDVEMAAFETLVGECTAEMVSLDAAIHRDTLSTIQKWSSKVQAVAPLALLPSSRLAFTPARMKSAAELVDEALLAQDKAIKRTWGKATRIGEMNHTTNGDEEYEGDPEAFDDRDFYQGLLRDVIESKGGTEGISAADVYANSKKQKKKVVDTRASKGRKLRYEPHEKLQHFMVPVPIHGLWHEEQIDELFASLLGKGLEEQAGPDDSIKRVEEGRALEGFRVFG